MLSLLNLQNTFRTNSQFKLVQSLARLQTRRNFFMATGKTPPTTFDNTRSLLSDYVKGLIRLVTHEIQTNLVAGLTQNFGTKAIILCEEGSINSFFRLLYLNRTLYFIEHSSTSNISEELSEDIVKFVEGSSKKDFEALRNFLEDVRKLFISISFEIGAGTGFLRTCANMCVNILESIDAMESYFVLLYMAESLIRYLDLCRTWLQRNHSKFDPSLEWTIARFLEAFYKHQLPFIALPHVDIPTNENFSLGPVVMCSLAKYGFSLTSLQLEYEEYFLHKDWNDKYLFIKELKHLEETFAKDFAVGLDAEMHWILPMLVGIFTADGAKIPGIVSNLEKDVIGFAMLPNDSTFVDNLSKRVNREGLVKIPVPVENEDTLREPINTEENDREPEETLREPSNTEDILRKPINTEENDREPEETLREPSNTEENDREPEENENEPIDHEDAWRKSLDDDLEDALADDLADALDDAVHKPIDDAVRKFIDDGIEDALRKPLEDAGTEPKKNIVIWPETEENLREARALAETWRKVLKSEADKKTED